MLSLNAGKYIGPNSFNNKLSVTKVSSVIFLFSLIKFILDSFIASLFNKPDVAENFALIAFFSKLFKFLNLLF